MLYSFVQVIQYTAFGPRSPFYCYLAHYTYIWDAFLVGSLNLQTPPPMTGTLTIKFSPDMLEWNAWELPDTARSNQSILIHAKDMLNGRTEPRSALSDIYVFRGIIVAANGTKPIAVKITHSDGSAEALAREFPVYEAIKDLQGSTVPICYGLFRGNVYGPYPEASNVWVDTSCLVTEYCGEPLTHSLHGISLNAKLAVITQLHLLHRAGYSRGDFANRNIILNDTNKFCIIDFGASKKT
ncbi:hypothetical protein BOTBODRAFT_649195 [Botryobasidium botryosum FD-172 SS1]|uniref:Protein kinase domain-containing protein n=1 Tax=Botryobasidium botryosum (strain FD-172 SS1) TaxID=930990 RepID=A0A067M773_BOTB1|nr:hypothetical protein BOTBODRAFT_649195 [Botryobasidium botryosum FD-172 SS1]